MHMSNMRLRQIEIFYHVYREGSISGAARALHVSQPSVSKVLRHAEDQLGFELFERKKGRLFPTQAADELFVEAQDVYARIGAFGRTAQNIRSRAGGHIRLGALPSLGFAAVPKFVAKMRQSNPNMSFDLSTLHTEEIEQALLERRYDICLGFGGDFDDRISQQHVGNIELVLLANPADLPTANEQIDLSFLQGRNFIGLKDSGPAAELVNSVLEKNGIEPVEVVSAHTHYVAASLVSQGVGVAIVDEFTARSSASQGLASASFKDQLTLPFCAIHLSDTPQRPLIDDCVSILAQLRD